MTKVTAGQQIAQPKRRADLLVKPNFESGLILSGERRTRLSLRLRLEVSF